MSGKTRKENLIQFFISFIVLFFDQATKVHISKIILPAESIPIVKGIFHLTLVHNTGIAFGLLQGKESFLIISSLLVILILIFNLKLARSGYIFRIPLAFILGGAVSNLVDRLRFGYVIDFLDFRVWPVFNIADSAITAGGIILFILLLRKEKFNKNF